MPDIWRCLLIANVILVCKLKQAWTGWPNNDRHHENERLVQCLEHSTASKKAWYESLRRGCLNKSTNEKFRLFSFLRALSKRKLGKSTISNAIGQRLIQDPSFLGNEDVNTEDWEPKFDEEVQDPPLSPVIAEDFSKPPQVTEEVSPSFFSTSEFFDYLQSSQWTGNICLRVIGGELLTLLLTALFVLERKRLLNRHVTYANLNNRRWLEVEQQEKGTNDGVLNPTTVSEPQDLQLGQKTSTTGSSLNSEKMKVPLPKPYETAEGWEYENLSVQLVYYEKPDMSSIPYVSEKIDHSSEYPQLVPELREVFPRPYVYRKYCMNRVRLPDGENIIPQETIAKLEAELVSLGEAAANAEEEKKLSAKEKEKEKGGKSQKDSKETKDSKSSKEDEMKLKKGDKENVNGAKVEWIASDPFLNKEFVKKTESRKTVVKSPESRKTVVKSPESQPLVIQDEIEHITSEAEIETALEEQPSASPIQMAEDIDIETKEPNLIAISTMSSGGSYVVVKAETDIFSDAEEEEPIFEELNLPSNELQVTGLYAPRDQNRRLVEERLKLRNKDRKKLRSLTAASVMKTVETKFPDIHSSFKTLAAAKEDARRKATAPRVLHKSTGQMAKKEHALTEWSRYVEDHEECEIDIALKNDLEKGVLERMVTSAQTDPGNVPKEEEKNATFKKGKEKKNKTQNKSSNRNFNSDFGERNLNNRISNSNDNKKQSRSRWCIEKLPPVEITKGLYSSGDIFVTSKISYNKVPCSTLRVPKLSRNRRQVHWTKRLKANCAELLIDTSWGPKHLETTTSRRPRYLETSTRREPKHLVTTTSGGLRHLETPTSTGPRYLENTTSKGLRYLENTTSRGPRHLETVTSKGPIHLERGSPLRKQNRISKQPIVFQKPIMPSKNQPKAHHRKANKNNSSPGFHINKGDNNNRFGKNCEVILLNKNASANSDAETARHSGSSEVNRIEDASTHNEEEENIGFRDEEAQESELSEENLSQVLSKYNCECSCWECDEQDRVLAHLRSLEKCKVLNSYPLILGKLSRDYRFLDKKDHQHGSEDVSKPSISCFNRLDVSSVCSHLLNLIDDVMVRKEILTSSLGHVYITVTFHRANRPKQI